MSFVEWDAALTVVASLGDEVRRSLYRYVRSEARSVTRDEAAGAVGVSRKLAAFHLDKLVERGLLVAAYGHGDPPSPRVGRAPKVYRPSAIEVSVSIPPRRYDTLGEILLDTISAPPSVSLPAQTAARIARDRGRDQGAAVRVQRRLRRPGPERTVAVAAELLNAEGFEARTDGQGGLVLANCPYEAMARHAPQVVCTLNTAFVDGLLRGLGNDSVTAELEPTAGRCCVHIRVPGPRGHTTATRAT